MNSMQITPIFDTRKLEILNKIKATQTENLINVIELVVNDNQFSGYQIAINFTDSQKRPIGAPHIFTFSYIEGQDTISFPIPSGLTQFQSVYFQIVAIYETKVWKSEVVKLYFNETLAETDGEISQDPMYSQWIFAINEAIAATEAAIEATNTANLLIGSFSNFAEYSPTLEYALYNKVYFKGSTYEYVNNTPTTGIAPIEKQSSEYWQLIASGSYIDEINTTVVGPDTNPTVIRGTSDQNVILDFSLPRAPTVELDIIPVVEKLPNQSPTVEDINPTGDMVLQFGLPRAPSVTSTIGTQLNANQDPLLTIGGTNGDVTLEFQLPKTRLVSDETTVLNPNQNPVVSVIESEIGDLNFKFDLPRVPEVFVANVDVVTSDQSPSVVNSPDLEGDSGLYFTIPRAPAVTVGSTTTLTPTSPATVTPTYTNGDVSLAFGVPKGDKGDTGEPFHVRGSFDTLLDLESSIYHPGAEGDAWAIGTTSPMDIYIWDITISGWVNIGQTYTYSTDFLNHKNSNKLHNNFAISTGTNDYVVTLDPVPTSYEAGMIVSFLAQNANTYHSTLNCNGLGAKTIFKNVYQNLVAGDISENQIVSVIYDGTNFQVVSGSGGSGGSGVFIPYKNRVITDSETNTVTIGIADYEATRDTIFTYQNSTYISKDLDYTVSSDSLTIVKISGTWATGTVFDFHVLALSNPQTNPIVATRHDSSFTAIENGTTICSFNYQNFYPALDSLFVYYQNLLLFEGVDYVINQNNLGITLASFSLNIGEKLNFVFLKNVIKEVNTAGSGQMLGTLATKMFSYNTQVLEETITIPSNYNASAVGPITVADGYWLNVGDGARLVIL